MKVALILLAAAVVALFAVKAFRAGPALEPAAALRTDQMIETLTDSGWIVVEAEEHGNLLWKLADLEGDTSELHRQVAAYARAAELAGARVAAEVELRAQAEAALRLAGRVHADTLMRLERGADSLTYAGVRASVDSIVAPFDDGVFRGRMAYFPRPNEFSLIQVAEIAAALAISEAPDGRVLISAIARDPRVRLILDRALYQPAEPVRICTLGQRAAAGAIGTAVGVVGTLLLNRPPAIPF